ncbi:hypothetical protein N1851_008049 [Merluccius polli]|uniref:Uncharacterized protein n=1 Tax=Merluccius polli TaxID=89951 RepID=A0AA47N2U6_MERPO|nr:hypothetical protein N1851_008049 [Merluccius polli]
MSVLPIRLLLFRVAILTRHRLSEIPLRMLRLCHRLTSVMILLPLFGLFDHQAKLEIEVGEFTNLMSVPPAMGKAHTTRELLIHDIWFTPMNQHRDCFNSFCRQYWGTACTGFTLGLGGQGDVWHCIRTKCKGLYQGDRRVIKPILPVEFTSFRSFKTPHETFEIFLWKGAPWPWRSPPSLKVLVQNGKAQAVYSARSIQQSFDYNVVKTSILRAYELVPEAYRQKFRNLKKKLRSSHL